MSVLLADIDATCAALGYNDGIKYQADPDAIQGLKVGGHRTPAGKQLRIPNKSKGNNANPCHFST